MHAFEPNLELCAGLNESIRLNRLEEKVTVHPVGVSDSVGTASFGNLNPRSLGEQTLQVEKENNGCVPLVKLDGMQWDRKIKMMKIDVEGMEFNVLLGAEEIIKAHHPIIYIENWTLGEFKKTALFFGKNGYQLYNTFDAGPTNLFMVPSDAVAMVPRPPRAFIIAR